MSTKEEIFAAIESEMEYQDLLWGPSRKKSREEFLAYAKDYMDEAMHILCRRSKHDKASMDQVMDGVRKTATLLVRCMEQHGVQARDLTDLKNACDLHGVKCDEETK